MKKKVSISILMVAISWIAFGLVSLARTDDSAPQSSVLKISQLVNELRSTRAAGLNPDRVAGSTNEDGTRPNSTTTQPARTETVMDELVFHYRFLQKRAEDNTRNGRNPHGLREYYKRKLNLSDAENSALTGVLSEADTNLKSIDAQLKQITDSYRAQVRNGIPAGQDAPKPPAHLRVLVEQRDSFLSQLPSTLRTRIGEAGFEKLNSFLSKELAPRIRANLLQNPGAANTRLSSRSN